MRRSAFWSCLGGVLRPGKSLTASLPLRRPPGNLRKALPVFCHFLGLPPASTCLSPLPRCDWKTQEDAHFYNSSPTFYTVCIPNKSQPVRYMMDIPPTWLLAKTDAQLTHWPRRQCTFPPHEANREVRMIQQGSENEHNKATGSSYVTYRSSKVLPGFRPCGILCRSTISVCRVMVFFTSSSTSASLEK